MKTKAAVFLNGAYPPDYSYFYILEHKRARADSVVVVADGGLMFFANHQIQPDVIIGDWDSADVTLLKSFTKALTITAPAADKAFTDGELALDWCLNNGIKEAVIYGGVDTSFETDHLLGNIFLLFRYKEKFNSIIMRDYCQEIIPLKDESYAGIGKPGDFISVIPLEEKITCSAVGLAYDPGGKTYRFGQTTPLRNQLAESVFSVEIKGRAVLVKHF